MSRSVVIVGINPGRSKMDRRDSSIKRLEGWGEVLGLRAFGFVNCIPYSPGSYSPSMVDYDWLRMAVAGSVTVALGGFASRALNKIGQEHFKLPHPSGLNRQTNDPLFIAERLRECREYLERNTVEQPGPLL